MNTWKAIGIDNTSTNDKFASKLENALNELEAEGFDPLPQHLILTGQYGHAILLGKKVADATPPS